MESYTEQGACSHHHAPYCTDYKMWLLRVSIATRIAAYGYRDRIAGNGNMGAKDPADAMRTFQKSSSPRASFAPYLTP